MRHIITILATIISLCASAINPQQIRWHNEAADTARLDSMLEAWCLQPREKNPGQTIDRIGSSFIGTPYVGHTLEGEEESLTINIDELDCTTFVETVMALAKTVRENRRSWRDFARNLESIRYRNGELNGYPSRLHYIAEWIIDNRHRGNIVEATESFPRTADVTKTISFMSDNRNRYPSLADSATFEAIKSVENKLILHRYPYIKTPALGAKETKAAFRTGDIVALTTSLKNLDVTHMGIVVIRNSTPYLLHASSSLGKVTITEVPLDKFMERNRSLTGLRVMRLRD